MSPDVEPNTGPISSQGGDEATARESTPFDTRATELFGIRYPIVQTGMGWVAGSRLTAATSAAGALGVLATATMNYDELVRAIQRVKERTSNPFGVNFNPDLPDLDRRINLTISEGIPVASFAGAPTRDVVAKLHDGGVLCVSTVGARRHAEKVVELGVDAIIAQGAESEGTRVPCRRASSSPRSSTRSAPASRCSRRAASTMGGASSPPWRSAQTESPWERGSF